MKQKPLTPLHFLVLPLAEKHANPEDGRINRDKVRKDLEGFHGKKLTDLELRGILAELRNAGKLAPPGEGRLGLKGMNVTQFKEYLNELAATEILRPRNQPRGEYKKTALTATEERVRELAGKYRELNVPIDHKRIIEDYNQQAPLGKGIDHRELTRIIAKLEGRRILPHNTNLDWRTRRKNPVLHSAEEVKQIIGDNPRIISGALHKFLPICGNDPVRDEIPSILNIALLRELPYWNPEKHRLSTFIYNLTKRKIQYEFEKRNRRANETQEIPLDPIEQDTEDSTQGRPPIQTLHSNTAGPTHVQDDLIQKMMELRRKGGVDDTQLTAYYLNKAHRLNPREITEILKTKGIKHDSGTIRRAIKVTERRIRTLFKT